ncbi:hypothetical protein C3942_00710 [Solimonas fluminis]|uniref:Uncharacterized protein n=1 Tax=Solimonas fluminis TaxID=2086571 RepID=A0A2S5TKC8_9GAMM|nr:hypothetical protein [Solimonas fluminis]PPE75449.1 hypothetical protein C3942_00710 [Solimonas fluminis]
MDGLFEQLEHACRSFAGPARSIATLMRGAGVRNIAAEGYRYELSDHALVITKADTPTLDGEPNPQRALPL